MNATEEQRVKAALNAAMAVADCIKELGQVPSGHLYARLMDKMSLESYEALIGILIKAKLVSRQNHLLTWVGR